jgi:hypothetical protein
MDVDDPTDVLLAGLINAERVIDEAVEDFYNENARVDSAVIAVLDGDSDDPPFEHDAPSAPCCSGNKRSFPLCWTEEQMNATSAALDLADKSKLSPDSFTAARCVRCRRLFGGTSHINAAII